MTRWSRPAARQPAAGPEVLEPLPDDIVTRRERRTRTALAAADSVSIGNGLGRLPASGTGGRTRGQDVLDDNDQRKWSDEGRYRLARHAVFYCLSSRPNPRVPSRHGRGGESVLIVDRSPLPEELFPMVQEV